MSVTSDDVRHIASLARIRAHESELAAIAADLASILAHMEVLQSVSRDDGATDHVRPMTLRDETAAPIAMPAPITAFAPRERDGFFLVPRLTTHE